MFSNCDSKIISKILRKDYTVCYQNLIKLIKNNFAKGRNIGDSIRLMFNIIDYACSSTALDNF